MTTGIKFLERSKFSSKVHEYNLGLSFKAHHALISKHNPMIVY